MDWSRLSGELTRAAGDPLASGLERLRLGTVIAALAGGALALVVALMIRLLARGIGLDAALALSALVLAGVAALVWRLAEARAARRADQAAAARAALIVRAGGLGGVPSPALVPLAAFVAAFLLARQR